MKKSAVIHRFTPLHFVFLILTLLLPSLLYAAPQMADYCYLPPFVTDPNTPPNIMIVYEKDKYTLERAYSYSYNSGTAYYGFFDSTATAYYKYNSTGTNNYFEKPTTACTPSSSDLGCIEGNVLNWAFMSFLDISQKVLVGFGWPDKGSGKAAGNVFTYKGCFMDGGTTSTCESCPNTSSPPANCQIPLSYGQSKEKKDWDVSVTLNRGSNYSYTFCLSEATGSNPTQIKEIRVQSGSTAPSCSGSCSGACSKLVTNGNVAMKFTDEVRYGLVQKYADKNQDYTYDSDAVRFGLRRWQDGADKQVDILKDSPAPTDANRKDQFKNLLNATSKAPSKDKDAKLGDMMEDIVDYFGDKYNATLKYTDNETYTQTPYAWSSDPAKSCRKTFALFVATGDKLGDDSDKLSPLPAECSSLTYTDAFINNTCYAYGGGNTDLDNASGKQNIRTYFVHTNFDAKSVNVDKLIYASRTVGGGEYFSVTDPGGLATALEEAILNILSTSASASTVATLTTQTRESSTLTQAYFYPKRENTPLRWIGYLRLLWSDGGANLREDTKNTGWLDLKNDNILSFFYDSDAIAYKARTYADTGGDLKIDSASCTPTATKLNDNVLAIWNAQTKLQSMSPADRTIKIGIGASGKCSNSDSTSCTSNNDCTSPGVCQFILTGSQMYDFTTAKASTLQPFWNYTGYCSNVTSRWCAKNDDCNYCNINTSRTCPGRADSACNYCSLKTTMVCSPVGASGAGTDCYLDYSPCGTITAGKCDGDSSRSCTVNADCIDNYGTCTADTCRKYDTATTFSCNDDCDTNNCATQVIKFALGYDYPKNASSAVASPGSGFRIRSQCTVNGDCPGGACENKTCRSTSASCTSDANCPSGDVCVGTCSSASYDVTKTLKLGDIVYSTPRISPNSAVNGYDVTYKDTTYSAFVNSRIKGKCSTNTTCPNTSDNTSSVNESCTSGICTNDGYTPIVIVGANDGMVHAFKVSKIKDFSPAEDDCGGLSCDSITTGNQTAAFIDKPNSALNAGTNPAPPADLGKELWGYIPFNAMPYLRWYCNTSYCHIPMLDARFSIVDASIDYDKNGTVASEATETAGGGSSTTNRCSGASTSTCDCMPLVSGNCNYPWRRLLVGAMGAGGKQITIGSATLSSSIFVLDITNSASPKLLWERPLPDGTLTTSTPVVVRLASAATEASKDENGKWYLVIGSGPTSITTNAVNYKTDEAKIYVFDLRNGDLKATISTGATGVAVGDMMAVDMDSDYQVDDIYFGTYGGTGAAGIGKLYRLTLRNDPDVNTKSYQTDPQSWGLSVAVAPGGGSGRPIFASPEIAQDSSGNIWIYFGTGVYLSAEHATSPAPNEYFYGFKESAACWKGITGSCSGYSLTGYTQFLDATNITLSGAQATELGCFCAGNLMSTISCSPAGTCSPCGDGLDTVVTKVTNATLNDADGVTTCDTTDPTGTAAIDCLTIQINSSTGCSGSACNGWKRTITGQKSFSKPFVAGGLANYTSFEPQSTSCSLGGNTHLWSLHYTTGTAYVQPTIFLAGGTSGATTSLTISASVNLGTGVPPLGESLVALPLSGDTYKVITQVSGGLPGTSMAPSLPAKSGYVLWIVK
jgi:Tfp pilus tip-associated adhesin PilY1